MKGIILAAGLGTRFEAQIPKPLTLITNNKTILDFQIEKLEKRIGIDNILIVVGYKKESIVEKFPELSFVYNKEFETTNTSKSLLLALKETDDDDVIWMNGDIYFDDEVLDFIIKSDQSCCLVDNKKCGNEEVKYNLNQHGFVKQLSKSINDPKGEALGINLIKKKDLDYFRSELEKVNDNDYFEKALENLTLNNKIKLVPISIGNLFCSEIDFPEDLDFVKKYVLG